MLNRILILILLFILLLLASVRAFTV